MILKREYGIQSRDKMVMSNSDEEDVDNEDDGSEDDVPVGKATITAPSTAAAASSSSSSSSSSSGLSAGPPTDVHRW